jgi:three-Cys-motif partner protein
MGKRRLGSVEVGLPAAYQGQARHARVVSGRLVSHPLQLERAVAVLRRICGRGRYNDGSEGSPLVALRHLVEHRSFPRMRDREFVFYLVEADKDNAESLDQEITKFKAEKDPWPANVKTLVVNEKFDVTATAMIEQLRQQKRRLAPTFAFVDPFGYSGLPLDLLADLLNYSRSEVSSTSWLGTSTASSNARVRTTPSEACSA